MAFASFVGQAAAYLAAVSAHLYVQEAVPSETDHEIQQICRAMGSAGPALGPEFAAALDDQRRTVLGIFARRVPQRVLAREVPDAQRADILASGLIAEAFSNAHHHDFRDVLVGLALHYECARRLSLDITDVFDAAATFADADTGTLMRIFGRRSDVTLGRFGWREIETPTGPAFESA